MISLSEILRTKLLPWSRDNCSEKFIVARPEMRQSAQPGRVILEHKPLKSPRVIVKNRRCYSNVRNVLAEWPAEQLQELSKSSLICVLDGHVKFPLGDYRLKCGAGYFIFIPAGIPVPDITSIYIDPDKSTFCQIITFLQHPNALEGWVSHSHQDTKVRYDNVLFTHVSLVNIFNALMDEVLSDEPYSHHISEGLLAVFMDMLSREVNEERFHPLISKEPSILPESSLASPPLSFKTRLERYIQANLRQPLTLDKVARDLYLSPAQLTRNVRSATGQSFNQLLTAARLQEAKNLLQNTEWAIFSIAELTGFRSTSYFCTFFKTYTGKTPSEFRELFAVK